MGTPVAASGPETARVLWDNIQTLFQTTAWRSSRRQMYERVVDVPRLLAGFPADGPGHPLLPCLADALSDRYAWTLQRISAACYRDGRDSVALHADKVGPLRPDCVIAIVSVGEPRKFVLRRTVPDQLTQHTARTAHRSTPGRCWEGR